ncbi:MAG: YdjY domain-containing protein [Gemmatales bacterium]|nr:YdjY domain-containing protein [Gemmatales bacterium]
MHRKAAITIAFVWLFASLLAPAQDQKEQTKEPILLVKPEERAVILHCRIAPRKLPHLKEIYPLEVVATYPHDGDPKGQKAHETVVVFSGVKPSEVHRALESFGLKPGKPALGEGQKAEGPLVRIFLEIPSPVGGWQRLPIERCMVDRRTNKPLPPLKWHFTGSVYKQPDPDKPEKVYAADLSGTLIAIFPVTNETVIQSELTMKDEPVIKLELSKSLPKEGTPVRLVIVAEK